MISYHLADFIIVSQKNFEKYFIMSAGLNDLFESLKFVKPLWYFHLDCGENVIWPESRNIIPPQLLDSDYESFQSTASEASYVALMNGHIQVSSNKEFYLKIL